MGLITGILTLPLAPVMETVPPLLALRLGMKICVPLLPPATGGWRLGIR